MYNMIALVILFSCLIIFIIYKFVEKSYIKKHENQNNKDYWQLFYGKEYKDITRDKIEECSKDVSAKMDKDFSNYKFFITTYITVIVALYTLFYSLYKENILDALFKNFSIVIILYIFSIFILKNVILYTQLITDKEKHLYILNKELSKEKLVLIEKKHKATDGLLGINFIVFVHTFILIFIYSILNIDREYLGITLSIIIFISVLMFTYYNFSYIKYNYSIIYNTKIIKRNWD